MLLESSFAERWTDPEDDEQYWLIFREHGESFFEEVEYSRVMMFKRVWLE